MTSDLIQLKFQDSEAVISRTGSAIVSLTLEGSAVIPETSSPRSLYHGVLLAPWPNRIAGGAYEFQGKKYQAKINEDFGNALHGLLFESQANVESVTDNSVRLVSEIFATEAYPWDLTVKVSFVLSEQGLLVETTATNNCQQVAPVGLGTHPYFVFDKDSTLEVRASKAFVHGPDMMPISEIEASEIGFGAGSKKSLENLFLDVQFTDVLAGCAVLRTSNWSIEIFQERADFLMVYTTNSFNWLNGETRAVAIEPQTSAADAFNNGAGLLTLAPNASASYVWGVRKLQEP
jgi:aldose 1-epimerase